MKRPLPASFPNEKKHELRKKKKKTPGVEKKGGDSLN